MSRKGLYQKYAVVKINGPNDFEPMVDGCFVLRPEKDPAALSALTTYAGATNDKELSTALFEWVISILEQREKETTT